MINSSKRSLKHNSSSSSSPQTHHKFKAYTLLRMKKLYQYTCLQRMEPVVFCRWICDFYTNMFISLSLPLRRNQIASQGRNYPGKTKVHLHIKILFSCKTVCLWNGLEIEDRCERYIVQHWKIGCTYPACYCWRRKGERKDTTELRWVLAPPS